jgi:hypothetical protein
MESNNELQRVAQSQTTQMIAAIMRGEAVQPPQNPTPTDKTEQDVLREIQKTYMEIVRPPEEKQ